MDALTVSILPLIPFRFTPFMHSSSHSHPIVASFGPPSTKSHVNPRFLRILACTLAQAWRPSVDVRARRDDFHGDDDLLGSEEDFAAWIERNLSRRSAQELEKTEKSNMVQPVIGGGRSRAGLFRTPISGGVQTATSSNCLPQPALAVRNLMQQTSSAHLCTVMSRMHHRCVGSLFGSFVEFVADSMGHPVFSFSPPAVHTKNLLADSQCTLTILIPGWTGLSNARVTIFGGAMKLPVDQQEWAHNQYIAKHQQRLSQQWKKTSYYRMQRISDIYFIGGFGTIAWIDVKEYESTEPEKIAADCFEQTLKELNAIFSKPLKELSSMDVEIVNQPLISIDSKGVDIRVRQGAVFNIHRLLFDEDDEVETLDEAKRALHKIIKDYKLSKS